MKIKESIWIAFCIIISLLIAPFYLVWSIIQRFREWSEKYLSVYYWID